MENLNQHIFLLFVPMILANSLHMVLVKLNLLERLSIPLSVEHFGKNKTWRGFVVLPILSGIIAFIIGLIAGPFEHVFFSDFLVGFGMGIVYLLAELPNSYVKRKLGIANGEYSKKFRLVQIIIDRADSLIAIFLYYYFVTTISFRDSFILFLWAMVISFIMSFILYSLKIKRSI